jgi:Domain of unknown function (DUF4338)
MSGRWIPQEVLERMTQRSQGPEVASRAEMVKQFCRATHWRDRRGNLCESSARIALKRLEARGLVQLPGPARQRKPSRGRRLLDDGQALPPLPQLPSRGRAIGGLRLRLIEGPKDPGHRIWNRLITREHPLQGAPLVGTQLRYLIECDAGIVGAFGFGPPAYHLACRDQWVGWSLEAREQNRHRVVGLSRFLIRSGLRVANLASQCYSLVARQMPVDWKERYGVRPEWHLDKPQNFLAELLTATRVRESGEEDLAGEFLHFLEGILDVSPVGNGLLKPGELLGR